MFDKIFLATLLVVVTVAIHAAGVSSLIRVMMRTRALDVSGFRAVILVVIGLTCWLILIHLAEIAFWGLFYFWHGCLPDAESAIYFSAVTYTTLGDGSLMLPKPWRMFAPIEALTAILMCGLSTGLFFALVSRWHSNWLQRRTESESQPSVTRNRKDIST